MAEDDVENEKRAVQQSPEQAQKIRCQVGSQIVACDRVSGEDCFVARAHVRDVAEMEAVIDRVVPFGATNSSILQSSPVEERLVEL